MRRRYLSALIAWRLERPKYNAHNHAKYQLSLERWYARKPRRKDYT